MSDTTDSGIIICIDLRPLETSNKFRGFGYYIQNLVETLVKIDKKNYYQFIIYGKNNPIYKKHNLQKNLSFTFVQKPNIRPRLWWFIDQFRLNQSVRKISPDIFVSLDTAIPLLLTWQKKIKLIATIHDLIPIVLKKEYQFPIDKTLEFKLKFYSGARADKVITISNYSKKDIKKYLRVSDKKITVTYEAVSSEFKPFGEKENKLIRQKFAHGKKYFMIIGDFYGIDPRKNYLLIVKSFHKALQKYHYLSDHILLFAGQSGGTHSEYSRIVSEAEKLGISDRVIFTGFVSPQELPKVYSGAEAMLYPSIYEGFGLPILQAMASGCPVITTNATSIPEVAGDAAIIFNLDYPEEFIAALGTVDTKRQELINKGYRNIKRFSWDKCARQTLDCIEKTVQR